MSQEEKELLGNRIDPTIFSTLKITIEGNPVSVLTNAGSIDLRKAVESYFDKEFSLENWAFITTLQKLNSDASVSPGKINELMKQQIMQGSPNQVNISSENRTALETKFKIAQLDPSAPMKVSDFQDALQEIIKLANKDTMNRAVNNTDVIAAYQNDNKSELQLKALHVLTQVNYYSSLNVQEIIPEKKPIFGFINRGHPFKFCQDALRIMKKDLTDLLLKSDNMTPSEFQKSYDSLIKKNQPIIYENIAKIAKKLIGLSSDNPQQPVISKQYEALADAQSSMSGNLKITAKDFADLKKAGIVEKAKAIVSIPVVEISADLETEIRSRNSNSTSISRRSP